MLQQAGTTGDFAAAIRSHAGPGFVMHMANGESGGLEFTARAATELFEAFPDVTLALDALVVDGDRAVIQFMMQGTHTGTLRGFAPTGKVVDVPVAFGFRVVADRIEEVWLYGNLYAPLIATHAEAHPDETV